MIRVNPFRFVVLIISILLGTLLVLFLGGRILTAEAVTAASVTSPFIFSFNSDGILNEAGSMAESSSRYFWLNSGGQMPISGGIGKTLQGDAPAGLVWSLLYAVSNALDTDNGKHPQSLFRLLTRSQWQNADTSVSFRINDTIESSSPNRDGYSGILLMSRYKDGQNLYYAGLRQDGDVVIKKKINGSYYTLAQKELFPGTYDRWSNPNLIPEDKWMGLKVRAQNVSGGVRLSVYLDRDNNGRWTEVLSATDAGKGGAAHPSGYGGIRTDYMDVEFDSLRIANL